MKHTEKIRDRIISADELDRRKSETVGVLRTGNGALDRLLGGGLYSDMIYLFFGDRKVMELLMERIAVRAFLPRIYGGLNADRVLFIDASNGYSPYRVIRTATAHGLNPDHILNSIYTARAFNRFQMEELVSEVLPRYGSSDAVLISGITEMFGTNGPTLHSGYGIRRKRPLPYYSGAGSEKRTATGVHSVFDGLKKMITGIKKITERYGPLVVITAPATPSGRSPVGGKIMTHFAGVVVGIRRRTNFIDYVLIKHPTQPFGFMREWLPPASKKSGRFRNEFVDITTYMGKIDKENGEGGRDV